MPRNLARLTVHQDGSAGGGFHPGGYSYLRLRGEHAPAWIPMDDLYAFWPDDEGVAVLDLGGRWWVRLYPAPRQVVQGGPRRLWDLAEEFHDLMKGLGWPAKDQFGLTVHRDGRHVVWLDDPESAHRWAAAP